jgi:hypothetical protein
MLTCVSGPPGMTCMQDCTYSLSLFFLHAGMLVYCWVAVAACMLLNRHSCLHDSLLFIHIWWADTILCHNALPFCFPCMRRHSCMQEYNSLLLMSRHAAYRNASIQSSVVILFCRNAPLHCCIGSPACRNGSVLFCLGAHTCSNTIFLCFPGTLLFPDAPTCSSTPPQSCIYKIQTIT